MQQQGNPYWSVPPMWQGMTVALMASGASMSKEKAERVRKAGLPSIVINTTYKLAPWATMLYAADPEWWSLPENRAALSFPGLRVSCMPVYPSILLLRRTGSAGFDSNPSCIRTGGNSGYQALHIALAARAAKVLLLGYDMGVGGEHWHGSHPRPLRTTPEPLFDKWAALFECLSVAAATIGTEVVNCSNRSKLTVFRYSTLDEELAHETCSESAAP